VISDVGAADRPQSLARPDSPPGSGGRIRIGLNTPLGGRLFRGLFAVAAVWYRIDRDSRFAGSYFLRTVMWFLIITVVFTLAWLLMSRFVLPRFSPWVATAILQIPMLVYPLHIGVPAFHDGLGLYTLLGLILNPLIGYGGAEVAVLPSLLTRRWHLTYTPFNLIDQTELALRDERHRKGFWWVLAVVLTVATLIEFWIVPLLMFVHPVRNALPDLELPQVFAFAFLVPAILLGVRYFRDRRVFGAADPDTRREGWAALSLLLLILAGKHVPDQLWGGIIVVGLGVAIAAVVRRMRRGSAAPA
jgi:hypothetical protein